MLIHMYVACSAQQSLSWDRLPISKSNKQAWRQHTLSLDNKTSAVAGLLGQYLVQNGNYKNNLGGKNRKNMANSGQFIFLDFLQQFSDSPRLKVTNVFFLQKYKGSYRFLVLKTHLLCISNVLGQ